AAWALRLAFRRAMVPLAASPKTLGERPKSKSRSPPRRGLRAPHKAQRPASSPRAGCRPCALRRLSAARPRATDARALRARQLALAPRSRAHAARLARQQDKYRRL